MEKAAHARNMVGFGKFVGNPGQVTNRFSAMTVQPHESGEV
jgi:hypothetical protein